jgi:galactose mutarotase-like enzyme
MAEQQWIEIASDGLSAAINPFGAELSSLKDGDGRALMTDADPAFWSGRAPLLFPIVGKLNGDAYRVDGQRYSLPQHGFARKQMFLLTEKLEDRARFLLTDNDETRAIYPFAFALEAEFVLEGTTLGMTITVTNRGDRDMPASFGFHPAFAWPLPYGAPRAEHRIAFAHDEPAPLAAIVPGGTIAEERWPSPLEGRILHLDDALFERDALVWDELVSQSLVYGPAQGAQLLVEFPETPMLGIWTKPGARFLCIEPWHGIADPHGFTGEIWDKPGILRFEPGEARSFAMRVTLRP